MIRDFHPDDLNAVMELWLSANLQAHDFIAPAYWKENFDMVKGMLPQAEILVWEQNGCLLGFLGMTDDYIAGVFVDSAARSKGIGKALLEQAKQRHSHLALHVYEKNQRAVNFYLREGFHIQTAQLEEITQETELFMTWHAASHCS